MILISIINLCLAKIRKCGHIPLVRGVTKIFANSTLDLNTPVLKLMLLSPNNGCLFAVSLTQRKTFFFNLSFLNSVQENQVQPRPCLLLEKEMATQSNILAWKIPCTEEPGRVKSMCGVRKGGIRLSDYHSLTLPVISTQGQGLFNYPL